MSGDDLFENFDPNAQALYLLTRRLFPAVTSYAYSSPGMGPQGFLPVPLSDFTGLLPEMILQAKIKAFYNDCEEGNIPLDLTEKNKMDLMSLICRGRVTGKADCIESSGGITIYAFYDQDDNWIGALNLEDGLLVMEDGRYYIDIP